MSSEEHEGIRTLCAEADCRAVAKLSGFLGVLGVAWFGLVWLGGFRLLGIPRFFRHWAIGRTVEP